MVKKLSVIFLMLFITGCAASGPQLHKHDKFTKHYEESLFEVTENGLFSVEMIIKEHELRTGVNMLDLVIHDRNDRDVTGAVITVTPWMPDMGHGVFEKPRVTERGGGLYTVENIILTMSGHWELKIDIKWGDTVVTADSVVFDFPDVKIDRGHEHKMIKAPEPSDLDVSTSALSDNKIVRISYTSDLEPVPVNKIHSWTLWVETPDGSPVPDARISVDGDMPEHGHGMPTRPEVTQEPGDGKYLVEGMKFSMPGWWVVKFYIKTQELEDTVTFNLLLKE